MSKKDEDKQSGGFGGFTSVRDMFDGGGRGRAGASFEGSPLSTFGNAAGIRPSGSDRPNPRRAIGFGDFTDGGGYGRSGSSFRGSPYSTMANAFGIRPMGSSVPNPRQGAFFSDFMDGGGLGQTGNTFSGSPMSMLANALGIKPMGYEDRLNATPAPQAPRAPQAGTGFGDDYSDMLMAAMGLGQNPYGITPEYVGTASAQPAPAAQPAPYQGQQIVPTMENASVPELSRYVVNSDLLSPTATADREAYLRYMNTGMYPQGY